MRASIRMGAVVVAIACLFGAVGAFLLARASLSSQPASVAPNPSPQIDSELPTLIEPIPDAELPATVFTDRKRPLTMYRIVGPNSPPGQDIRQVQLQVERNLRLIPSGPEDEPCNCHGWIFTAGHYWLKTEEVEQILRDNGYDAVAAPAPGDLVIYRDPAGAIAHSALVRTVNDSGKVVVESRWGNLGRYLHEPRMQVFSENFSYFRSSRRGHTLEGVASGLLPRSIQE